MPPIEESKVTCFEETDEDENTAKKIKTRASNNAVEEVKIEAPAKIKNEKCFICKQYLNNIVFYKGHPNNSCEEYVALTDEKLSLFTGNEEFIDSKDDFPTHKITNFTVYDKQGHLCPFDTGLIERNILLHFSGYIKPVYEEDPNIVNGIPAHDMGPINEWWTEGYDGGEKLPLGFSTEYAQYYLMEPSPEYQPFLDRVQQKTKLSKIVIEFLVEHSWENPSYEDLVQHIDNFGEYPNVEDTLLQHAQFLCDQLVNFEQNAPDDENEKPLISLPCMRSLVNLSGVTFQKRKGIKKLGEKGLKIKAKKRPVWTKAVTTDLVKDVFENFFPEQIDNKNDPKGPKKKRCGICEACQSPDCGQCSHCKDMLKFGGSGRSKQACKNRKCPNMAILDAELSDNEGENDDKEVGSQKNKRKACSKKILHKSVTWGEKSEIKYKGNKCYASATVDDIELKPGDFVTLKSENPNEPLCVIQIVYMYDMPLKPFIFHGLQLCRGNETILGETSDPRELFLVDDCDDYPLGSILRKAEVECRKYPENWHNLGGELNLPHQLEDNGVNFFYSKRYDSSCSRFIDLKEYETEFMNNCISCRSTAEKQKYETPTYDEVKGCVEWRTNIFKVGTGIFLLPDTCFPGNNSYSEAADVKENVNDEMYPEYYRKKTDNVKGSNADTPEPFVVGLIEEIQKQKNDIKIKVRILYRPENLANSIFRAHIKDLNFVYWTEQIVTTSFNNVTGKCYIEYGANLEYPFEWTQEGPHRFYFTDAYCTKTKTEIELPSQAKRIGTFSKGKGGGKIKGKGKSAKEAPEPFPEWGKLERPLRCMDVFAGCGGLSEGLHQAGIAESKWAIEIDQSAAQAFRLNNPNCKVFTDDCNHLLTTVLNGEGKTRGLPEKGEVEMLVGGPPCQGFSGMNRFNAGQYSLFKNSLVVSYLSYCEYYRPKFFILENVRNFVSFKRSMVLKLTVRCLLAMGYQVAFGVLQAGHYGIPQTRRRLILMAAAPGYVLPKYPEPQYVFNRRGTQLSFVVDNFKYQNGNIWTESAPYRTICVRDAMSDLPDIKNGWNKTEMAYDCDAMTHFQKMIRKSNSSDLVKDHICKEMSALVEARMSQVPTYPGADWRDLPNISLKLNDGTTTNILNYSYRTKKQKKDEKPRGVCQCALGEECNPLDRQFNTLIPWCLPHTADRHNHWAGLYGRLEWDGFFGTTVTNPEPMGKQGRVLHPEQNRVVSVRECARSQGFPDKFQFYGNILDKHRQVGNAVPPPLGAALGREIRKALIETEKVHSFRKIETIENDVVKVKY